jgi:hypothetical protein
MIDVSKFLTWRSRQYPGQFYGCRTHVETQETIDHERGTVCGMKLLTRKIAMYILLACKQRVQSVLTCVW